ncbi:hypothetical protein [Niallia sp. Krafla_26]|uniref:hypothetical protein n=1 Tax=Niallia sp. Krafla_26 TaxID=3064703 RepID=UPI003D1633EE
MENMKKQKSITQFTRTVRNTDEYIELQRCADQAGATITGTKALTGAEGLTVFLEKDSVKRQF